MEKYTIVKQLGSGSYGDVFLVKSNIDNKQYVMKKIFLKDKEDFDNKTKDISSEVKLLSNLRHPNIVEFYESFQCDNQHLCIIMAYCEGGDLFSTLKARNKEYLDEKQILDWFIQIALALLYMHQQKVIHRDLKTQNVFLTKRNIVKIGDFGISRALTSSMDLAKTMIGTPYYMSPEVFENKSYDYKSDVWSLGCCLYEMIMLKHAFDAKEMPALIYQVLKGNPVPIASHYSDNIKHLVSVLLEKNPSQRPSIADIFKMPFIRTHMENSLKSGKSSKSPQTSSPPVSSPSIVGKQMSFRSLINIKDQQQQQQQQIQVNSRQIESPVQLDSSRPKRNSLKLASPKVNPLQQQLHQQQQQSPPFNLDSSSVLMDQITPLSPKREASIRRSRHGIYYDNTSQQEEVVFTNTNNSDHNVKLPIEQLHQISLDDDNQLIEKVLVEEENEDGEDDEEVEEDDDLILSMDTTAGNNSSINRYCKYINNQQNNNNNNNNISNNNNNNYYSNYFNQNYLNSSSGSLNQYIQQPQQQQQQFVGNNSNGSSSNNSTPIPTSAGGGSSGSSFREWHPRPKTASGSSSSSSSSSLSSTPLEQERDGMQPSTNLFSQLNGRRGSLGYDQPSSYSHGNLHDLRKSKDSRPKTTSTDHSTSSSSQGEGMRMWERRFIRSPVIQQQQQQQEPLLILDDTSSQNNVNTSGGGGNIGSSNNLVIGGGRTNRSSSNGDSYCFEPTTPPIIFDLPARPKTSHGFNSNNSVGNSNSAPAYSGSLYNLMSSSSSQSTPSSLSEVDIDQSINTVYHPNINNINNNINNTNTNNTNIKYNNNNLSPYSNYQHQPQQQQQQQQHYQHHFNNNTNNNNNNNNNQFNSLKLSVSSPQLPSYENQSWSSKRVQVNHGHHHHLQQNDQVLND